MKSPLSSKLARRSAAALCLAFLAAPRPASAEEPPLEAGLIRLADDPDPRVRMQAAFALGESRSPARLPALAKIARRGAADRWTRAAVLSSVPNDALNIYVLVAQGEGFAAEPGMAELAKELAGVVGARLNVSEIAAFAAALADAPPGAEGVQAAALQGLGEGIKLGQGKGISIPAAEAPLAALGASASAEVRQAASRVAAQLAPKEGRLKAMESAIAAAADEGKPASERVAAIGAIDGNDAAGAGALSALLDSRQPEEIQAAAIVALGAGSAPANEWLLPRWRGLAPKARERAIEAVFGRKERIAEFMGALESGSLPGTAADPASRARLVAFPDEAIAARAKKLFQSGEPGETPLFDRYKKSLELKGDPARGAEIHAARCAQCHRVGKVGYDVGPAWAGIKSNPPDKILLNILYPSQLVTAGFANYIVETTDGRLASGLVVASTPASVTMRRGLGEEETILRKNIKSMTETALSMMPEGLEQDLSEQQMADLLAFVLQAE